jgi:hypothetical protein
MLIALGKPTHYRPSNRKVSACGVVLQDSNGAYDARYTNCLRCMKTMSYKIYMCLRR